MLISKTLAGTWQQRTYGNHDHEGECFHFQKLAQSYETNRHNYLGHRNSRQDQAPQNDISDLVLDKHTLSQVQDSPSGGPLDAFRNCQFQENVCV